MQEILLTLAGAAVLSVVCEVLVSSESMKKFARLAIGISVSTIMVIPIAELLSSETLDLSTPTINEGYIEIVDSQYVFVIESTIETCLAENGITAEIQCDFDGEEITLITATSSETLTKETAEEIGFAICELASVPLSKVAVKSG
ncbi:MAG: hypothetical protein R3Y18_04430 [Bacillota bacterium]